jgi:hypothetical protein
VTGIVAKSIWEKVVEPCRREAAKVRANEQGAAFRYEGMIETLSQVRLALVDAVTRGEDGVLSEITSEYIAMEKLAKKGEADGRS